MNSKSLLIAIAALALTATGAHAFNSNALMQADLTEEQRAAFEVARELRAEGDIEAARDILIEAGIDEEVMERVRKAMSEHHHSHHEAMEEALTADDYEAFLEAIKDTPLADIITSEDDFNQFKEAHTLKESGDMDAAKVILDELGVEGMKMGMGGGHGHHRGQLDFSKLTEDQKDAFEVSKEANDRETMHAILIEAGVIDADTPMPPQRLRDGRKIEMDDN